MRNYYYYYYYYYNPILLALPLSITETLALDNAVTEVTSLTSKSVDCSDVPVFE